MNTIDLVAKAKEVQDLLSKVILDNTTLAQKAKDFIAATESQLTGVIKNLETICEEWIDIRRLPAPEADLRSNVKFWEKLPDGLIRGDVLKGLVHDHSTTLKLLHQRAVDIKGIYKFSEQELRIASEIGDKFNDYQDGWTAFKRAFPPVNNEIIRVRDVIALRKFLELLRRRRYLSGYAFFYKKYQGGSWEWEQAESDIIVRNLRENDEVRFQFQGFQERWENFFKGNWFNAYAYEVFFDQLRRMETNYEIYPMVQFSTASGGRETRGDFDLVVNMGKRIILVECKSGRITREGVRDDFRDIREKTQTLERAFASTRITDCSFLLLFNPAASDLHTVRTHFKPLGVEAFTPNEIRMFVIDLLNPRESLMEPRR